MAEPVWQFRLSVGHEPLFSVPVRTQGCQTLPNAHPWASHPITLVEAAAQVAMVFGIVSLIREHGPDASHAREGGQEQPLESKRVVDVRRCGEAGDRHAVP